MNLRLSVSILSMLAVIGLVFSMAANAEQPTVGLITKTETNPFFVKMKEGAQQAAQAKGVKLMLASGKYDGDDISQLAAIARMVSAGAKAILITPNSAAIVPALKKARGKGVLVIALDTPTEPEDGADALFATNNFKAGFLIGKYARAATKGKQHPKIAMMDLSPEGSVGKLRHQGFLEGFGIKDNDPNIVCKEDTYGDVAKGKIAMKTCLKRAPQIDVVYTINEPAAAGAYQALQAVGREKSTIIVSIDGGCAGVKNVAAGIIAATSQQYPLKMAALGVEAGAEYAKTGKKTSGYTDTGVTLITNKPLAGIGSKDTKFGLDECWGN